MTFNNPVPLGESPNQAEVWNLTREHKGPIGGWVERNGKIAAFSLNVDMPAASDAPKRVAVGKAMLAKLGIL